MGRLIQYLKRAAFACAAIAVTALLSACPGVVELQTPAASTASANGDPQAGSAGTLQGNEAGGDTRVPADSDPGGSAGLAGVAPDGEDCCLIAYPDDLSPRAGCGEPEVEACVCRALPDCCTEL